MAVNISCRMEKFVNYGNGTLIWITGLAGSGKTTIGKAVWSQLKKQHSNAVFLDGDSFREILGGDLGHDPKDRLENAYRIARMCKFLVSQNIIVVCATMSLYAEIHEFNRQNIKNCFEIFVDCEMEELIRRDQKGLYSKALKGETSNVVGVDLPYDKPKNADLVLDNSEKSDIDKKVSTILNLMNKDAD